MKNQEEHIPVLVEEVVKNLAGLGHNSHLILDGTFGRGGHTKAILEKYPHVQVFALDRDQTAVKEAKKKFFVEIKQGRLKIFHKNFLELENFFPEKKFSVILLDLGVSSPQLDQAHRGFSFYQDGPLDMRMDQGQALKAWDIVNTWDKKNLHYLFSHLGEIRSPHKVVRSILSNRKQKTIETTKELSDLIVKAMGWKKKGQHPATKYFLALRLYVNSELEILEKALPLFIDRLDSKGRLLVIFFHSLEGRIVKNVFKTFVEKKMGIIVNKKVIQTPWSEKKKNPRARSAQLRIFEKSEVPL